MCDVMVGNRRRFGSVAGVALGVLGFGAVMLGVVSSPAVAATGSWSTPVNLSASGANAQKPQISVDAAGNAIAVWQRDNGSNYIVQTSTLTLPSLAETGTTSGTAITGLGVGAGLLVAGAVALVVVRRRLAHR